MSKHKQEGLIVTVETNNPYVGWDPFLGTRYIALCVGPVLGNNWSKRQNERFRTNQKQVQHYDKSKRMMFTRSIGYS